MGDGRNGRRATGDRRPATDDRFHSDLQVIFIAFRVICLYRVRWERCLKFDLTIGADLKKYRKDQSLKYRSTPRVVAGNS